MHGKTRTMTAAVAVALAGAALLGSGCRTAMRGAPYKRLITSYAESVRLSDLTQRRLIEAVEAGESPDRIEEIRDLHDEVTLLSERWHDSLDLRRREGWNRTRMNLCWDRYVAMFPEDKALRKEHKQERRIAPDELRSRRTPLTHDARMPWAPPAKDGLPYGPQPEPVESARPGSWVAPAEETPAGAPMARPAPAPAARTTPAPAGPVIKIEPSGAPVDLPDDGPADPSDPTEEMLMELLEDQAREPRGG